jgi:N-methylhydantoinase A/oxoprolinase/acetone carboxylase beta subunit
MGLDAERAAVGMYRVINANMAHGVREITVKRGLDPREFPMVVAGGAGALHGCAIASDLEMAPYSVFGALRTHRLYQDGATLEKKITLKMRDEDKTVVKNTEPRKEEEDAAPEIPKTLKFDNIGMSVRSLTAEEKKELKVETGVLVAEVKPYGEAFNRFIAKNSVIVEADRKPVSSPSDLKRIIDARKAGESVLLRVKTDLGVQFFALQIPK